jgi:holo-[acyl-carrier protein] synthase
MGPFEEMIVGFGIDITEVARIGKSLDKYGDRFIEKLFTAPEREYCSKMSSQSGRMRCFAGRFAAKEAFLKALGTGLRNGIKWTDIEVANDRLGKPELNLKNRAAQELDNRSISNTCVTLSHSENTAVAAVVLEKKDEAQSV